jgi:hypothetical protein
MTVEILKLNAYGHRWHVSKPGIGIIFSANTLRACLDYCIRHAYGHVRV